MNTIIIKLCHIVLTVNITDPKIKTPEIPAIFTYLFQTCYTQTIPEIIISKCYFTCNSAKTIKTVSATKESLE